MDKNNTNSEIFNTELNFISDKNTKDFVSYVLNNLPDYFRHIGASTSGKYHPAYTLGEGGLIRHTKAAVAIAKDLFNADFYLFDNREKDVVISALILHDGLKCGMWEDHTAFDHPLLIADFIKEKYKSYTDCNSKLQDSVEEIITCVSSHMGKWNTSEYSDKILPLPITNTQKCVHLCDYLASRKHLIFDFDVYNQELNINR